jgi:hypothetical protein
MKNAQPKSKIKFTAKQCLTTYTKTLVIAFGGANVTMVKHPKFSCTMFIILMALSQLKELMMAGVEDGIVPVLLIKERQEFKCLSHI